MKLRFTGGHGTKYRTFPHPTTGVAMIVEPGDEIEVTQEEAVKIQSSYPDNFETVVSLSQRPKTIDESEE